MLALRDALRLPVALLFGLLLFPFPFSLFGKVCCPATGETGVLGSPPSEEETVEGEDGMVIGRVIVEREKYHCFTIGLRDKIV